MTWLLMSYPYPEDKGERDNMGLGLITGFVFLVAGRQSGAILLHTITGNVFKNSKGFLTSNDESREERATAGGHQSGAMMEISTY